MWLFYAPLVPYWIWNSLRAKSFSYFCKVNPGIKFGGFLDYSKFEILNQIPKKYLPKTEFITHKSKLQNPTYPFVVKPDFGERGKHVEIIRNENDWAKYPIQQNLIIQEFIDYPFEFGVFYARNPKEPKGEVLSITGKEFLIYEADGISTLQNFIESHPRAQHRIDYFKDKFADEINQVHPKGTRILLEPIGNHNRGTKFLNANHLISEILTEKIDEIAQQIDGFYYGRFDIKSTSIQSFQNGEFIILEINGANSEATHIYDPSTHILVAYKEVKRHLDKQFEIAVCNPKTYSSKAFYKAIFKRIF